MLSIDNNRQVSGIVLGAIRNHLEGIQSGIETYRADPTLDEELDESIRRTRVAKCATSIGGFATLNRLLSLQEDVLESITVEHNQLDDDAFEVLMTLAAAIHTYIETQQSQPSSELADDSQDMLATTVRAYRRYRGLPEAEDEQAINELCRSSTNRFDEFTRWDENQPRGCVAPKTTVDQLGDTLDPASESEAAPSPPAPEVPPELLEVFQEEAEGHINNIYTGLSSLAKDPNDRQQLQEVRRAAHTFKGAAGAIGLLQLSQLSHRMEDVLDELYDGDASPTQDDLTLLLETTDVLQDACSSAESATNSIERIQQLIATYEALGSDAQPGDGSTDGPSVTPPTAPANPPTDEAQPAAKSSRTLRVPSHRLDDIRNVVSELMINRASLEQTFEQFVKCADELPPVLDRMRLVCHQLETQYEIPALLTPFAARTGSAAAATSGSSRHEETSEFDELELDRYTDFHLLSRSVAETTSDTSAVSYQLRKLIADFETLLAQQNRLMRSAQQGLLQVRMVEFGSVTPRLERAVRQVADSQNKKIELVVEGAETEIDKTVLEELVDPLLHLLRNSADHGVESSDVRAAQGKPALAQVKLTASHYGTQVVIRISDDGKGLDGERIRNGIIQGGYLSQEDADALTPQELHSHIFIPGFSTASQVSEISGRGVGMDVVRTNIERLKGSIQVESSPSVGTTFTIRLPTTLVVTRALIATNDNETFAIPTHAVAKIMKIDASRIRAQGEDSLVDIDGTEYRLVRLDNHLEFKSTHVPSMTKMMVAIIKLGETEVALSFDKILCTRDIVVKGLGDHLGNVRGLLGVTVLGDGSVVPILDPVALTESPELTAMPRVACNGSTKWDNVSVMIVDDSVSVRRALCNLMEYANWTPTTAKDGLEALEIIGDLEAPPHIVLLDVEMPRMDGYELLSVLRNKPAFEHTPIIMITSRAGEKHRRKAVDLGATAYVVKPFQDEALLQLMQRHIAQSSRLSAN